MADTELSKIVLGDWFFWKRYPLSWLIEKFWPVPGWTQEQLAELKNKEPIRDRPEDFG